MSYGPEYFEAYLIGVTVAEYGIKCGLEPLATGGGCDFMVRRFADGRQAVLVDSVHGESPDQLNEPSDVDVFTDEEWHQQINTKSFETAEQAMNYIKEMK